MAAEATNELTKVGRGLLPIVSSLVKGEAELLGGVSKLTDRIGDVWRAWSGDKDAQKRITIGRQDLIPPTFDASNPFGVQPGIDTPLTDAAARDVEDRLMAFYQSPEGGGLTKAQAAGKVAGTFAESGGVAHGRSNGEHVGSRQVSLARRQAIFLHFGKRYEDMDLIEQAKADVWEESTGGPEEEAGRKLRATTTPYDAGYSDSFDDQRPGLTTAERAAESARRGRMAQQIAARHGDAPVQVQGQVNLVVTDQIGNVYHTQPLPVTTPSSAPPQPWGATRSGQATPAPPAPPTRTPLSLLFPGGFGGSSPAY
jgi:hypothetical protein